MSGSSGKSQPNPGGPKGTERGSQAERAQRSPLDQAKRQLDAVGLRSHLQPNETSFIFARYGQRLREAASGNTEGLKMVDTLADADSANKELPKDRRPIVVIDFGGTNLRVAVYETDEQGNLRKMKQPTGRRGVEEDIYDSMSIEDFRQFESVEAFADLVATKIKGLGVGDPNRLGDPAACGYIFSFSGKPVEHNGNIDVQFPTEMVPNIEAKGFSFPGIDTLDIGVGDAINQALARQGIKVPDAYTIMNDTPVLALSEPDRQIGLVVGTGANIAFVHKDGDRKVLYNTALASFNEAPTYELYRRFDNSGKSSAFREIGGLYLGDLMMLAIQELQATVDTRDPNKKLFNTAPLGKLTAREMSFFARGIDRTDISTYHQARQLFKDDLTQDELDMLAETSRRLLTRSAELMGTFLGTLMATFPEDFSDAEAVPAMGSVFFEAPRYSEQVKQAANSLLEQHGSTNRIAEFTYDRDAGLNGIAYAALGILQRKEQERAA